MPVAADSPFDLSDHVALVTGGNGGIGLGMAEALAAHGADVAIWGTNPDKNDAAMDRLGRYDVELLSITCDVGDESAVVQAMSETIEELGRVDSVFVNAGVGGQASSFVDMTAEEWRRVMRVNLDGAFFTAREAVRHMVARYDDGDESGGAVVFTTSGSARFGAQSNQHYAGSKGAVISMMKGIAVQHARHGVRCNAILPGWIETDMTSATLGWDRFVERVLPRVPMRRWGQPDDFGGLAVYLASPASTYHTGDVLTVDGGYHSF